MYEIVFFVTGPSVDQKYGIAALNLRDRHCAVVMPFLREYSDAERLADTLREKKVSISALCEAFLAGTLKELI